MVSHCSSQFLNARLLFTLSLSRATSQNWSLLRFYWWARQFFPCFAIQTSNLRLFAKRLQGLNKANTLNRTVSYLAPKDALQRIQIGQSFAEYDLVRDDPGIFVSTPASLVASQPDNHKCFFVGRRGSGKTAITYHLLSKNRRAISIAPQIFDLLKLPLSHEQFHDTRQRPFKSLVSAFERALLGELAKYWSAQKLWHFSETYPSFNKDRGLIEQCDFDTRVINIVEEIFEAFSNQNDKLWLRQIRRSEDLIKEVTSIRVNANFDFIFLIDRLDESWDGSDSAIICLMALMHACVHLRAACPSLRPYLSWTPPQGVTATNFVIERGIWRCIARLAVVMRKCFVTGSCPIRFRRSHCQSGQIR